MKLHLPKQLFTALLAVFTLVAVPATLTLGSSAWGVDVMYDADGNEVSDGDTTSEVVKLIRTYTSKTNGCGTGNASFDGVNGNTFNLLDLNSDVPTELVIEGTNGGVITSSGTNGGWGGRVNFSALQTNEYCTNVTLTKGIEADITNIQGKSDVILNVNNASIFGSTSNYALTLNVGADGVRFNGASGSSYTLAGAITGTGNFDVKVGDSAQTLTITGDTSQYTGTWKTAVQRAFVFGNGSACANGIVGGNVHTTHAQADGVVYNYSGEYTVAGSITTTKVNVRQGTATFNNTVKASTSFTVAQNAAVVFSGNESNITSVTNNGAITVSSGTTTIGTLASSGTVSVGANGTLNLGANTHSIGTLNADAASTLGLSGGTLNLAGQGTETASISHSIGAVNASANSTINIESYNSLNRIANTGSGVVSLTGSGTYDLGSNTDLGTSVQLDTTWAGTVKISDVGSGSTNIGGIINELGNPNSKVELSGVEGYLNTVNGTALAAPGGVTANMILTNKDAETPAILLVNGNCIDNNATTVEKYITGESLTTDDKQIALINGTVTGSGDIKVTANSWPKGDRTAAYKFTGDVSGWTGSFIENDTTTNGHSLVIFTGTGANTVIQASFEQVNANKLYLRLGDAGTTNTFLMSGTTTVNRLVLQGSATFTNQLTVVGGIKVAQGKTLTLNGGKADTPISHSVGTLSAAEATVSVGANSTLSLGSGDHSVGTLSAAEATVSAGANSTLSLGSGDHTIGTLTGTGTVTNSGSEATNITISSGGTIANRISKADNTGAFNLTLGAGNTTFSSDLVIDSLTASGKTVTFSGNATFGGAVTIGTMKPGASNKTYIFGGGTAESSVTHTITTIDPGSNSNLTYQVNSYSTLAVTNMWMASSYIKLADEASFIHNSILKVVGNGAESSISRHVTDGSSGLSAGEKSFKINNADVYMLNSTGTTTLGMTLTNSSLTHEGAGDLTVDNSGRPGSYSTNSITALNVKAGAGKVTLGETMRVDAITAADKRVVEIAAGKTLNMGEGNKVQLSGTGSNAATMTAKSDNAMVQLQQDASFTIADMTLTNTTITAATVNTQVSFDNVTVSGAVVLKNLKVVMSDAQVAAGGSEGSKGTFTGSTTLLSGITMNAGSSLTVDLGDLSSYAAMGPGKYDLSITLSGFSMADFVGAYADSALQFAADSWLGQLLAQSNNAGVQITIAQAEAGAAAADAGGASTGVSYSTGSVGTIITITGLNVPEPTTATLSLLALAALAARRRRQA